MEKLIKTLKQCEREKWYFFREIINGKNIEIKIYFGKVEAYLQIFKINGIDHSPGMGGKKLETIAYIKNSIQN